MNYEECTQKKPLCKLIQKLMLSGATMSYMLPYSCECDEYASFCLFSSLQRVSRGSLCHK